MTIYSSQFRFDAERRSARDAKLWRLLQKRRLESDCDAARAENVDGGSQTERDDLPA
jgi:hypothetical protein